MGWALEQQHHVGIPEDAEACGLPPFEEPDYLIAVEKGLHLVDHNRAGDAQAQAADLDRRYARLPGGAIVRCHAAQGSGHAAARKLCEAALRAYPDSFVAHAVRARISDGKEELDHLQKEITLRPDFAPPWDRLAELYRKAGRTAELADLEQRRHVAFAR